MRNITVCISDEIYLYARLWAARRNLSVPALVRKFLESLLELPSPAAGTRVRTLKQTLPPLQVKL